MRIDYRFTNAVNGGFGQLGNGIKKGLESAGHIITRDNPDIMFFYGVPEVLRTSEGEVDKNRKCPLVYYTVWESSIYPPDWAKIILEAKCDLVLTATEYNKEAMKRSGVEAKVWHHGVDERWKPRRRVNDGKCTFIHWNAFEWRKGWEVVLKAFLEEFEDEDDVELILKGRDRGESVWLAGENESSLGIPKVREVIGHLSNEELENLIYSADVGVFPVKGEGWFMPSFEFASSGGVVLLPKQGGLVEQWGAGYIEIGIDGWFNSEPRYNGAMFWCSVADLRKKMRWCYDNQDKLSDLGMEASEEVIRKFNWCKIIKDLEDYFNLVLK